MFTLITFLHCSTNWCLKFIYWIVSQEKENPENTKKSRTEAGTRHNDKYSNYSREDAETQDIQDSYTDDMEPYDEGTEETYFENMEEEFVDEDNNDLDFF